MYCRGCGRELKGTEKFCPSCGLQVDPDLAPRQVRKGSGSNLVRNGVFVVLAIAVAIFAFVNMSSSRGKDHISAKSFKNASDAELFALFCQAEENCVDLTVTQVTGNPLAYCDGTLYRFAGKVVEVSDSGVLLQLCDSSACENNMIYFESDEVVFAGDEVCVFGVGIGTDTYYRTYLYGLETEFTTLVVDAYYILTDSIDYGVNLPDYMEDLVYGTYKLDDSYSSVYLRDTVILAKDTVTDYSEFWLNYYAEQGTPEEYTAYERPLEINEITLGYAGSGESLSDTLDCKLSLHISGSTMVLNGTRTTSYECIVGFGIYLDGSGFMLSAIRASSSTLANLSYSKYLRTA